MPSGEKIADAYVQIEADLSNVPSGMNKLDATVARKILDIQKKTAAQLARTQLEMKVAVNAGDFREITRLNDAQDRLRVTMGKVNQAAVNQAAALAAMGGAANRAAAASTAAPRTPGGGGGFGSGSMSGGMGLMVLSQTIDDMQYGFRAIVNQIPQIGMGLASMFGASAEAGMKFGAVLGIVGVAVNYLINHWDELMDHMGFGKVLTEAEQMEKLGKATKLTADEQERLNRFKQAEKTGQELGDKKASGVEKTTAEVKAAIGEMGDERTSGRGKLVNGLVQARRASGHGTKIDEEEQRQLDIIKRDFGGTKYGKQLEGKLRAKIQERLDTEDVTRAGDTVDKATFDSERRKGLISEMRANPQAFPAGAANKLDAIVPVKSAAEIAGEKEDPEVARTNAFNEEIANKAREARKAEDERLAGAMSGSVGQKYLQSPTMSDETMQAEVKKSMEKAGMSAKDIGEAMTGTAKKLRENLDKAVKDRALDRGVDEGVARQQLLKEARAKDDKQADMPKSEVMSTGAYLNRLLVAGLSGRAKPDDKALEAQQDTAKATMKFADLAAKWESRGIKVIGKDNPARVAPGR